MKKFLVIILIIFLSIPFALHYFIEQQLQQTINNLNNKESGFFVKPEYQRGFTTSLCKLNIYAKTEQKPLIFTIYNKISFGPILLSFEELNKLSSYKPKGYGIVFINSNISIASQSPWKILEKLSVDTVVGFDGTQNIEANIDTFAGKIYLGKIAGQNVKAKIQPSKDLKQYNTLVNIEQVSYQENPFEYLAKNIFLQISNSDQPENLNLNIAAIIPELNLNDLDHNNIWHAKKNHFKYQSPTNESATINITSSLITYHDNSLGSLEAHFTATPQKSFVLLSLMPHIYEWVTYNSNDNATTPYKNSVELDNKITHIKTLFDQQTPELHSSLKLKTTSGIFDITMLTSFTKPITIEQQSLSEHANIDLTISLEKPLLYQILSYHADAIKDSLPELQPQLLTTDIRSPIVASIIERLISKQILIERDDYFIFNLSLQDNMLKLNHVSYSPQEMQELYNAL